MGHFWAEGVVLASQFEESGFDISLSQQVLSATVVIAIVTKTPHEYIRVTYKYIRLHTTTYEYIRVTYDYIRVTYDYIRVTYDYIRVT